MNGWMDGCMDGWNGMNGWMARFKLIRLLGFLDDGVNEHEEETVDEYGDVWRPVTRKGEHF